MKKLILATLALALTGCRTWAPEQASETDSVVANKHIENILKGLKFRQDYASVGGKENFDNNHVVVFYVDGLIRSVAEDMALHGDRYLRYMPDGSRFLYTKKMITQDPLDRGMLWGNHDDKRVAAISQEKSLSQEDAVDFYIRTEYLKLNNIREFFMDRGIQYKQAYTILPSLTIPSNGSMWTGVDSDRHSIKSQGAMDRVKIGQWARGEKFHRLSTLSSVRYEPSQPIVNYRLATEDGRVPTIMDILRYSLLPSDASRGESSFVYSGIDFAPSLPIHPSTASGSFSAGYANGSWLEASPNMDATNFEAMQNSFQTKYFGGSKKHPKLMILWLPNTDHLSHGEDPGLMKRWGVEDFVGYGQYGPSLRLELKRMDQILGEVIKLYKARNLYKDTTFILTADHGHLGGDVYQSDLASSTGNVVLVHPESAEQVKKDIQRRHRSEKVRTAFLNKRWSIAATLSANLKTNVLLPAVTESRDEAKEDYFFDDKEVDDKDLIAVDNEGFGHAKIYLPYQSVYSRDWMRRNRLSDLRNYEGGKVRNIVVDEIVKQSKTWDLVKTLFLYPKEGNEVAADLVIVPRYDVTSHKLCRGPAQVLSLFRGKLRDNSIQDKDLLIYQTDLLNCSEENLFYYDVTPGGKDSAGRDTFDNVLGFKDVPRGGLSLDEWFKISLSSDYPDAMRLLFRDAFNRERAHNAQYRTQRDGPDIIVYAKEGWNFRSNLIESTDHGYALKGSVNVPFMAHSPRLKGNKVYDKPVRLTDLTPTILKMLGLKWDESQKWFDGKPIKELVSGGANR